MFSAHELEWKFQSSDDRESCRLLFSNENKTIEHNGDTDNDLAAIKLENKFRKYIVTIKNIEGNNVDLRIGVCDDDWRNKIYYDLKNENICGAFKGIGNEHVIKHVARKFKNDDTITIEDKCIAKLEHGSEFHSLSIFHNGDELFNTFYATKAGKQLYLCIGGGILLEVEVEGKNFTHYC